MNLQKREQQTKLRWVPKFWTVYDGRRYLCDVGLVQKPEWAPPNSRYWFYKAGKTDFYKTKRSLQKRINDERRRIKRPKM